MKKEDVFPELYVMTQDAVKDYRTDFDHDKRLIDEMPEGTPFIHIAREMGTHMYMLPPAMSEKYPKEGERVPYLFSSADRNHMLRMVKTCIEYHYFHHNNHTWTYFDGKKFTNITPEQAMRLANDYTLKVKSDWIDHE